MRILNLAALAVLILSTNARADADFTGVYTITSAQGPMSLRLQQADGRVSGSISMGGITCDLLGAITVDEDDEVAVEGAMTCANSRGDFDLSWDEEEEAYLLLVIPYDTVGTPRLDLATLYSAVRTADTAATSPPAIGTRDPRLVGMWSTQVVMNTPGGNMATQMFMEIRADGILVDLGSRSMGSIPGVSMDSGMSGGGETAAWRTNGDILEVSYAGSRWVQLARFEVSDGRLLLNYYDGDRKLWYRQ